MNSSLTRFAAIGSMVIFFALVGGCGKEEETHAVPAPSKAVDQSAQLTGGNWMIAPLLNNEDPVVANNAKRLEAAFQSNDYSQAAFSLSTIASLRVDAASEDAIRDTLSKLMKAVTAASENGDANAKFALNHLKETFGQ